MTEKYIFLLSGGIDSSISALKIISERKLRKENFLFLFFDRRTRIKGVITQVAYRKEIQSSRYIAKLFKKELDILKLPMDWYADAKKIHRSTFPHGRNTLFLTAAASYAAIKFPHSKSNIIVGFIKDDGEDATDGLVRKFNILIRFAFPLHDNEDGQLIKIIAPFVKKHKFEVIRYGFQQGTTGQKIIKKSWSCYFDGSEYEGKHCGRCTGCIKRKTGFKMMNMYRTDEIIDPTDYYH